MKTSQPESPVGVNGRVLALSIDEDESGEAGVASCCSKSSFLYPDSAAHPQLENKPSILSSTIWPKGKRTPKRSRKQKGSR